MIRGIRALHRPVATGGLLAFALAASAVPATARTWFVPGDFNQLTSVLMEATAPGDTIRLAGNGGSTYYVNESFSLLIPHELTIEGGWRVDFTVRDPDIYVSVIRDDTGDYAKPIFRVETSDRVTFDGLQMIGGRFGILAEGGADLKVVDCRFRSHRNESIQDLKPGGALRQVGGTLDMRRCRARTIITGDSGSGLFLRDLSSARVEDTSFGSITSSGDGGILWADGVGDLVLDGVDFEGGTARFGRGALLGVVSTPLFATSCSFRGGISLTSGGAAFVADCPEVTFDTCRFEACYAPSAAFLKIERTEILIAHCDFDSSYSQGTEGGAVVFDHVPSFRIEDTDFVANYSARFNIIPDRGGAVYAIASDGVVEGCGFLGNRAIGRGGAWSQVGGEVTFDDCRFVGNDCLVYGGALQIELGGSLTVRRSLFDSNSAKFGGGVVASFTGQIDMESVTMTGNSGRTSGACAYAETGGRISIDDSIVCCAPKGDLVFCSSAVTRFSHSDFWNDDSVNARNEFGGSCVNPIGTDGNFSADPRFCDPSGSDDFLLRNDSPCLDAGSTGGYIGWRAGCGSRLPQRAGETTWGRIKALYRAGRR